jgi:hypothetical protein
MIDHQLLISSFLSTNIDGIPCDQLSFPALSKMKTRALPERFEKLQSVMKLREDIFYDLSSYYNNNVKNIKVKEKYSYGDVVKLREYIPARQKGRKKKTASTGTSASDDQVVLSTNKNSGSAKICDYCKNNRA